MFASLLAVLPLVGLCSAVVADGKASDGSILDLECSVGSGTQKCSEVDASLHLLQTKAARKRSSTVERIALEPKRRRMPRGFVVQGPTPKDHELELSFFVKQRGVERAHDALLEVSDPDSELYGKHWSNKEVLELLKPDEEHINAVMEHLQSHGIIARKATPNGDILSAVVTAEKAETLLQTKYEAISHVKTGHVMHRCLEGYTLPADVARALDFVSPTVHLTKPAKPMSPPKDAKELHKSVRDPIEPPMGNETTTTTTKVWYNNSGVCPDPALYPTEPHQLRTLYSLSGTVGQDESSKQAVTGFIGQTYNLQNLKDYWQLYCHGMLCGKGLPGDVGDKTEGTDRVEAMLDVDVITGVAGNVYTEFWGFDSPKYDNDPFVQWIVKVSETSDEVIPKVFSTSYGEDEIDYPAVIADRYNVEFMKMGLRGISVFFAAGDEGANLVDLPSADEGANLTSGKAFLAEWPASSPFVTAVGALAPTEGFPRPGSETATALSSGGFSQYFSRPSWQVDAVETYLSKETSAVVDFVKDYQVNTTDRRAYPDISAQGYSFCVTPDYVDGVYGCGVGGTSAASPTSAGIFSLLNDLRAQHGKSPLGFLNPLIYKYPEAFQDITIGYNTLNGSCASPPGWPATVGWDPTTGYGSPNYAKLAEVVLQLP
jgi:tripeptidyl-peptidase-1